MNTFNFKCDFNFQQEVDTAIKNNNIEELSKIINNLEKDNIPDKIVFGDFNIDDVTYLINNLDNINPESFDKDVLFNLSHLIFTTAEVKFGDETISYFAFVKKSVKFLLATIEHFPEGNFYNEFIVFTNNFLRYACFNDVLDDEELINVVNRAYEAVLSIYNVCLENKITNFATTILNFFSLYSYYLIKTNKDDEYNFNKKYYANFLTKASEFANHDFYTCSIIHFIYHEANIQGLNQNYLGFVQNLQKIQSVVEQTETDYDSATTAILINVAEKLKRFNLLLEKFNDLVIELINDNEESSNNYCAGVIKYICKSFFLEKPQGRF